jgi:hypothetical protein
VLSAYKHKAIFLALVLISVICGILLFSGSQILVYPLLDEPAVPAGTFITWTGLIAWAFAFRMILEKLYEEKGVKKSMRIFSLIFVVPALWWGIISNALSGNWSFNFSSDTGTFQGSTGAVEIFLYHTLFVVCMPVLTLIILITINWSKGNK